MGNPGVPGGKGRDFYSYIILRVIEPDVLKDEKKRPSGRSTVSEGGEISELARCRAAVGHGKELELYF